MATSCMRELTPIVNPSVGQHSARNRQARRTLRKLATFCAACVAVASLTACGGGSDQSRSAIDESVLVEQGKQIFRFDTFGDESQWSDTLRMHEVIATAVDPTTALSVGLKVDAEALPPAVVAGIQNGSIDLKSTDTTIALLKLNAVVGVQGKVETIGGKDTLTRVGITCALCHSTVDDSFSPGIGKRLDGWPNRDLNPGPIIALSPALSAAQSVFNSWGKGKYDPRFNLDGQNGPQVIPPAYGLRGIDLASLPPEMATTSPIGTATWALPRWVDTVFHGSAHGRQRHQWHG